MRRRLFVVIFLVAAALATAAVCWWRLGGAVAVTPVLDEKAAHRSAADDRPRAPSRARVSATGAVLERDSLPETESVAALSPEDQKITDELYAVRQSENVREMSRVVAKAAKSSNPDVRRDAVDTLRLFGRNGMSEATLFMCDEDDDVRNEAFDAWRTALFEFDDDGEKSKHILMMMSAVTDREQLDFMTQQIGELSDYHKANTLVTLITGKNAAASEIARREYKDLTGVEFSDVAAAQKWLDAQAEPESETEEAKNED